MAYETVTVAGPEYTTYGYSTPKAIRPEPDSPSALKALAEASATYATAADRFIAARDELADARDHWQNCRDRFAKAQEVEGV